MSEDEKLKVHLEAGIAIYNSGEYHAAHGAWERYWLKLEKGSEDRLFLQGLIQFTAIIYHGTNENWRGMRGLVESSLGYLEKIPEVYRGVDIGLIREYLIEISQDVESFSQEKIPIIAYRGDKMELAGLEIESVFLAAEVISEEVEAYEYEIIKEAISYARGGFEEGKYKKIEQLIVAFVKNPDLRGMAYGQIRSRVERMRESGKDIKKLFG
ncbi:DUF309 domain-containing protein [Candidatus Hikarchaeum yamanae]|uniref:DUF309 domain-containing protein n=1 Tax=Candidatus Hikarchaeum yamanae TaxID=2675326 RepID=UPI0039E9132E|tara:strand:- start:9988 stop:10623 length:636 start_codon:yes stop_codon:yes gene_type:complete